MVGRRLKTIFGGPPAPWGPLVLIMDLRRVLEHMGDGRALLSGDGFNVEYV